MKQVMGIRQGFLNCLAPCLRISSPETVDAMSMAVTHLAARRLCMFRLHLEAEYYHFHDDTSTKVSESVKALHNYRGSDCILRYEVPRSLNEPLL